MTPEAKARALIDSKLEAAGWVIQDMKQINLGAAPGIAVREFPTDTGPADYLLFVDRHPIGVIEAKRDEAGENLTAHEAQTERYASARLKWRTNNTPLRFMYESTGKIIHFTDAGDPRPRARELFHFFQPQTLAAWAAQPDTLRARLAEKMPALPVQNLRECQISAVTGLEKSLALTKPRALVHMATGAGKTFTAITSVYRLLKFGGAKRILFLVDTRNLGKQAHQEFMAYSPPDDGRKFTELYNVQRLSSSRIDPHAQVCICTIQRMYSILSGEEIDESAEDISAGEIPQTGAGKLVRYNPAVPIEEFDFIVIDECHRSIYNLWKQVLDYFDAFLIGLTATPDNRTYGFFNGNVVAEYSYEQSVDRADALIAEPIKTFDYVLANPPFGKKSSMTITNEDGDEDRDALTYERQDFWQTTSNKQLNFLQHIVSMLKTTGQAAVVLPDNVLFEGGAGEKIRRKLLETCDVHTLLRLPTGIFYAQGVKANVVFFDAKPKDGKMHTKGVWIYDLRTNKHFTLKTRTLKRDDLQDFIDCYHPANRHKRKATERFKYFDYKTLVARDKASLDIFWLKDDSLDNLDDLPPPDVLAQEIVEHLEAALDAFRQVAAGLEVK